MPLVNAGRAIQDACTEQKIIDLYRQADPFYYAQRAIVGAFESLFRGLWKAGDPKVRPTIHAERAEDIVNDR